MDAEREDRYNKNLLDHVARRTWPTSWPVHTDFPHISQYISTLFVNTESCVEILIVPRVIIYFILDL